MQGEGHNRGQLRPEEEHRHLLAQGVVVDAVEAASDARGDPVGDERRDEGVELLPLGTSRKSETQPLEKASRRDPLRVRHDDVGEGAGRQGRRPRAEIWVEEVTTTSVAGWPPTVTVAPSSKSVPKIAK